MTRAARQDAGRRQPDTPRPRLHGRVALVTGGGRGIGRAVAESLAKRGARLVLAARTRAEIDRVARHLEADGTAALAVPCDVRDATQVQDLVRAAERRFRRLDIVVNNAGGQEGYFPFLDISEQNFRFHFDWNTTSAFLLSQLAAPYLLKAGRGAILNISSGAGTIGIRGMLPYGVAKAGLEQLTRSLAEELAPKIRVNALALGAILTPALQQTFDLDPAFREGMIAKTPLKRIGTAESIGAAAVFACSDASDYMTGAILKIDGGLQDTNLPFKLPDL
jgi:NAD(P)-dependent dehydrogenase (short-subunit alcohol dehydrogenase family)